MEPKNDVFVDANVFIALVNENDALHATVVTLWDLLRSQGVRIVTLNTVIAEVLTVLSQRAGKDLAVAFGEKIYGSAAEDSDEIVVVYSDRDLEAIAYGYFKAATTKNISFVDATIFAILEQYQIKHLASFDSIFRRLTGVKLYH